MKVGQIWSVNNPDGTSRFEVKVRAVDVGPDGDTTVKTDVIKPKSEDRLSYDLYVTSTAVSVFGIRPPHWTLIVEVP